MIDYLQFKVYEHAVKYHRKLFKCVSVKQWETHLQYEPMFYQLHIS